MEKKINDIQRIWIRETMDRHGVSSAELAERMHTTPQNVYYLMREGGTQTKISSLIAIADAIGCDLKEFFTSPEEIAKEEAKTAPAAPLGLNIHGGKMVCPHCGGAVQLTLSLC